MDQFPTCECTPEVLVELLDVAELGGDVPDSLRGGLYLESDLGICCVGCLSTQGEPVLNVSTRGLGWGDTDLVPGCCRLSSQATFSMV